MKAFRPVDAKTLAARYSWFASEKISPRKMLGFLPPLPGSEDGFHTPAWTHALGLRHPPFYVFRHGVFPSTLPEHPDDVVAFVQDALAEFPSRTLVGYASSTIRRTE